MRFAFRAFPAASGGEITPRPIVDIALEGLEAAPLACMLDSGALRTRMSAEFASLAGIELGGAITEPLVIAGVHTTGAMTRVNLTIREDTDSYTWDAPVWFCDPWPFDFGLAGLEGFFQHFQVTISAYQEYLEIAAERDG